MKFHVGEPIIFDDGWGRRHVMMTPNDAPDSLKTVRTLNAHWMKLKKCDRQKVEIDDHSAVWLEERRRETWMSESA